MVGPIGLSKPYQEPVERDGSVETSTLDLRREAALPILHKRIYGSVEALEGEERLQRNRRFRIEASTAAPEVRNSKSRVRGS